MKFKIGLSNRVYIDYRGKLKSYTGFSTSNHWMCEYMVVYEVCQS